MQLLTTLLRRAAAAGSLGVALTLGAGLAAVAVPAHADEAKETKSSTTVRPEIGKPVQAAQEMLKAKKAKEALAKAREADAVPNKTPYETYVVQLTLGQAAGGAGDPAAAAAALEAAAAVAPSGKGQLFAAAAGQYYLAKNYAKSADIYEKYKAEGGNDPALYTVYIQSLYLGGNFAQAAKELNAGIRAAELAGEAPPEQSLQIAADIANKQKDSNAYLSAMEKLVTFYPKPNYWAAVVYAVSTKPGLSDRLQMDVLRLKRETNTLRVAEEYVDAIQLGLQAGFPFEANKFLNAGYDAKLLGTGAEADRHKRLKDAVAKALTADEAALGQDDAKVTSIGGDALFNTGLNYVTRGKYDKGLFMMEQAFTKGTLKRPEEAKLRFGMALALAGQKSKAIETLKGVTGKDGSADLARLWSIIARSRDKD
jgi:hypothetical protein